MTVEVTLTDLSGLIEYTFADIDLQFYAGGGAIFEFADYLDQNYLTGPSRDGAAQPHSRRCHAAGLLQRRNRLCDWGFLWRLACPSLYGGT